jgi:hypothetical protein
VLSVRLNVRSTHTGFAEALRWQLAPFQLDAPQSTTFGINLYTPEDELDEQPLFVSYFIDTLFRSRAEERWVGDLLSLAMYDLWRAFAIASRDYLLIHSGSVALGDRAVLLPAAMDAGKSSLTLALLQEGFSYLSDEFGAIDPVTGRVHPVQRPMALDQDAFDRFPGIEERTRDKEEPPVLLTKRFVRAQDVGAEVGRPSGVGAIVFPEPAFGGPARLERVTKAEAVERLVSNAFNVNRYEERAVVLLGRVVAGAETYRLSGGTPQERARVIADSLS